MTTASDNTLSLQDAYLSLRTSLEIGKHHRSWDRHEQEDDLHDAVISCLEKGFGLAEGIREPKAQKPNSPPKDILRWLACVTKRRRALRLRRTMTHRRHQEAIFLRLELAELKRQTCPHPDFDFSSIRRVLSDARKRLDKVTWKIRRLARRNSEREIAKRLRRSRWFIAQRLKLIEATIRVVIEEHSQKESAPTLPLPFTAQQTPT